MGYARAPRDSTALHVGFPSASAQACRRSLRLTILALPPNRLSDRAARPTHAQWLSNRKVAAGDLEEPVILGQARSLTEPEQPGAFVPL